MSQNKTNFAVPLAFVGMMFFAIGFALGINSFLIPVLKGALSLPSGVAYLLLAATFVPFLIFGYPASATIAKIGYKRTMALSFLIFAVAFILLTPAMVLSPLMVERTFGNEVWRLTANEIIGKFHSFPHRFFRQRCRQRLFTSIGKPVHYHSGTD